MNLIELEVWAFLTFESINYKAIWQQMISFQNRVNYWILYQYIPAYTMRDFPITFDEQNRDIDCLLRV